MNFVDDVQVTYPKEGAMGLANVRPEVVRQATYEVFTDETGKKFHAWMRELD